MDAAPEPPTFKVAFRSNSRGLRAHVTGPDASLATAVAYWNAIAAEVRKQHPASLLLIDELGGDPMGEEDWRQLVKQLQGQGLEGLRIAHVKPNGLQQVEYCGIFAREAGLDASVFDNEAVADIWLRYGAR